jgi:hypothetical protein
MLRGVPETEHIAVRIETAPGQDFELPLEPKGMFKAKQDYEDIANVPERVKNYVGLLEQRIEDLEMAFPDDKDGKESGFAAIDSIHRSHSVTHLVCGI